MRTSYAMETVFRPWIARLPRFLQDPIVYAISVGHYLRHRRYGAEALAALEAFPESTERRALSDVIGFCVDVPCPDPHLFAL